MGEAAQSLDNKDPISEARARSLANLRPAKPGEVRNPGGRPFSLMRLAREKTNDGQELIDFALRVLRGQEPNSSVKNKLAAMAFLAERGWGKPIQPIVTKDDSGPPKNYGNLSDEEFKLYADLWSKLHIQTNPTTP